MDVENNTTKDEHDVRKSAEEMDAQRQKKLIYEYLCHLEEAKKWMEACLDEELPPATELEENLRNGVYLAKLAHFMAPDKLQLCKIFDIDQRRYAVAGLQFRHTDNINYFLKCLKTMQLPLTFQPETTDIYDKKNMPRVIYCIHALSTHLHKLGKAPQIQDLYGKVKFTDAEIDAVNKELREQGIQLPTFEKIDNILSTSLTEDSMSLQLAIIAINDAIAGKDENDILLKLQDHSTMLDDVFPRHIKEYCEALIKQKENKNKKLSENGHTPNADDELLTQEEIQECIDEVNVYHALESLKTSLQGDVKELEQALKAPVFELTDLSSENLEHYRTRLSELFNDSVWKQKKNKFQWQSALQSAINSANGLSREADKRKELVKLINMSLTKASANNFTFLKAFYKLLTAKELGLSGVEEFAVPLYYEEMKIDKADSGNDLSYSDIVDSIRVLSEIAKVTKAIDTGNPDLVYEALKNPNCHISGLDEENKVKYYRALSKARWEKKSNKKACRVLSYIDIQECVDNVNNLCQRNDEMIEILNKLNQAVVQNNRSHLVQTLKNSTLKLQRPVFPEHASLYLKVFKKCLAEKHSDGSMLWLEDVENVAKIVAADIEHLQALCAFLRQVNMGLQQNDVTFTVQCIRAAGYNVPEEHKVKYFKSLQELKKQKRDKYSCACVRYITPQGNEAYVDLSKYTYTWDCAKNITECSYITRADVAESVKAYMEKNVTKTKLTEEQIITLQAYIRGWLLRKKMSNRFTHFHNNVDKIIKLQAWWRGVSQRKRYVKLLQKKKKKGCQKLRVSFVEPEKEYPDLLTYYQEHEDSIIKVQALWRGRSERKAFHSLLRLDKPPFPVVRHFSSILNFNAEDYDKDLQLQYLKHEVVQIIRHNQDLSQQLDSMDIKIGLLIQNRITLQDVVALGKKLETLAKRPHVSKESKNFKSENLTVIHKGLKSLTKEGRKKLEGYQHLFYALQTNPTYLSKLLFLLPQSKTNKFLQNVILTLYNFGSNMREEYLLLKLFGSALQEEIRCNFRKPSEVVTGNPLVLKMAVNYARQLNGQRALRQIVGPLIEQVLSNKTLNIETNPVDIYKGWRNQLETATGELYNLPHTVNQQEALEYSQVRFRLVNAMELLQKTVLEFLNRITESRDLIPYGMLYMAKVLNDSLTEKFPQAPEKDILKVVGNLIYFHFINAAIVAPDAFDIITLPVDRSLSNDQRRNLASIAKILQFAASKKGFGEEATHLVRLNSFIIDCHEKFKNFFRHCCQIEGLEEHFNIHEYTEATLIQKPEIYISLQEICDTHCLMLEYQDQIAPDPMDTLHDLLEDLGPAPTVASLLGIDETMCEANLAHLGKTEVCLVLTNKFEVPETDEGNLNRLFIKTKELLVSVLQFLKGPTLVDALEVTSPIYDNSCDLKTCPVSPTFSVLHRNNSSLNDCKLQLRAYLNKLELGGWVSQDDGYQNIITAVAKDLCNKSKYRQIRNRDLQTLRMTKQRLEEKTKYYKEQVEYYNQYIQKCLENLHTGKGSLHAYKALQKNNHGKLKSKITLKYTAAKLHEKGVLLEVDGLPTSQFKNVGFEISPAEYTGLFTVRCKFMGVEMEKIEIDIQKLLELQFEGSHIMDMFGKAKINVNLLLFLLNRKFYGKT